MSGLLKGFAVTQAGEWAGRQFYQAQDRRTGQLVHLMAEYIGASRRSGDHPHLPPLRPLGAEGEVQWWAAPVQDGPSLESLRGRGLLTPADLSAGLLAVIDGLAGLAALRPPIVPAFVDPNHVRRDLAGRWTVDYFAMAHQNEARRAALPPPGVYSFGLLLHWLMTGHKSRTGRVQVTAIHPGVSPGLQLVMIRCLGRSYPTLAELRADVARAAAGGEFATLLPPGPGPAAAEPGAATEPDEVAAAGEAEHPAQAPAPLAAPPTPPGGLRPAGAPAAAPAPEAPPPRVAPEAPPPRVAPSAPAVPRVLREGPYIPMDDRPWAPPPRLVGGYRSHVVPKPPHPLVRFVARWGALALFALAVGALSLFVAYRLGLVPALAPAAPGETGGAASGGPAAAASADPGEPPLSRRLAAQRPAAAPAQPPSATALPSSAPAQPTSTTPVKPPTTPAPTPAPAPAPAKPAPPPRIPPEPGSSDWRDAITGSMPILIHVNGAPLRWAYLFPHPTEPTISLAAFNSLFGRMFYWVPDEGDAIRLLSGDISTVTRDYLVKEDRIWLRLNPKLQAALRVKVTAYTEEGLFFETLP